MQDHVLLLDPLPPGPAERKKNENLAKISFTYCDTIHDNDDGNCDSYHSVSEYDNYNNYTNNDINNNYNRYDNENDTNVIVSGDVVNNNNSNNNDYNNNDNDNNDNNSSFIDDRS